MRGIGGTVVAQRVLQYGIGRAVHRTAVQNGWLLLRTTCFRCTYTFDHTSDCYYFTLYMYRSISGPAKMMLEVGWYHQGVVALATMPFLSYPRVGSSIWKPTSVCGVSSPSRYRDQVAAMLPSIQVLDGKAIVRTWRARMAAENST